MFVILTEFQGTHVGCIRVILKNDYLGRRRYKNYFQIRGRFTTCFISFLARSVP